MSKPFVLSIALRAAAPALAAACAPSACAQAPVLSGQWESVGPEASGPPSSLALAAPRGGASAASERPGAADGPMFATRSFTFDGDRWRVTFRAFGDPAAKAALFTLEAGGAFVVGGASAKVAGAWEGNFPALYRRLTADSAAGAGIFANAGCAIQPGQTLSLVDKGCGFVPALMQAMGEYDLVAMKDGQLYLGDRAGDLTKARPESLTPHPLRRR